MKKIEVEKKLLKIFDEVKDNLLIQKIELIGDVTTVPKIRIEAYIVDKEIKE